MCYLVSSFPPARSSQLMVMQTAVFDVLKDSDETKTPLERAKLEAERLVREGYSEVKVWSFVDAPVMQQVVSWPADPA